MLTTSLRDIQSVTYVVQDWVGQGTQISAARSNPHHRLKRRFIRHDRAEYSDFTISVNCFLLTGLRLRHIPSPRASRKSRSLPAFPPWLESRTPSISRLVNVSTCRIMFTSTFP